MKQISNYITEKLRFDKSNIILNDFDYNIGEICLRIEYYPTNGYAYFDVVKISSLDIDKKKLSIIELPYRLNNREGRLTKCRLKILKKLPKYLIIDPKSLNHLPSLNLIILNNKESIELLNDLINSNDKEFDVSKYIGGDKQVIRTGYENKNYNNDELTELLNKVKDEF